MMSGWIRPANHLKLNHGLTPDERLDVPRLGEVRARSGQRFVYPGSADQPWKALTWQIGQGIR